MLSTGRVTEVIAVPAAGRQVLDVSGGSGIVVYTTARVTSEGSQDTRFFVRFSGEKHGAPILGLPAGASRVQAQL
jgi:hypothetical protein